jgi:NADPH:quinone reductase-like Zn-dependent oxidoreductase
VAYPGGVSAPRARVGLSPVQYDALTGPERYASLNQAIVAAKLEVPIAAEFPLSDAAGAQRAMAAGHVLGKIVLRIH